MKIKKIILSVLAVFVFGGFITTSVATPTVFAASENGSHWFEGDGYGTVYRSDSWKTVYRNSSGAGRTFRFQANLTSFNSYLDIQLLDGNGRVLWEKNNAIRGFNYGEADFWCGKDVK